MTLVYKYQTGLDRDIVTLTNDQIFAPTKDTLNDPFEGLFDKNHFTTFLNSFGSASSKAQKVLDALIEKMNKVGIYSLSKDINNELLWAHYADQHKGFAIEFDLDIIVDAFNYGNIPLVTQIDVLYSNTPSLLNINDRNDSDKLIQSLIGVKSLVWQYENEVRLIFNNTGLIDIPFYAIKSIYFGLRSKAKDKDKVMKALRGRGVNYYEMDSVPQKYLLEPKQIVDKYKNAPAYKPNQLEIDEELFSDSHLGIFSAHKELIRKAADEIRILPKISEIYEIFPDGSVDETSLIIYARTDEDKTPVRQFGFLKKASDTKFIRVK
jgi:hypothetical protein